MGKPNWSNVQLIGASRSSTWGSETSQYPEEQKANVSINNSVPSGLELLIGRDSVSSGERKRISLNFFLVSLLIRKEGCRDSTSKR